MIAQGAARDLEAAAKPFDAALDELLANHRVWLEEELPRWRRIQNGDYNRSVEEDFQRNHEDDGWAAGEIVDVYVERLRSDRGWLAVADHPRSLEVATAWARAVRGASVKPTIAEARALIAAARKGGVEATAWRELRQNWPGRFAADLKKRVLSNPDDPDLREELAACLVSVATPVVCEILDEMASRPADLMSLIVELRAAASVFARKPKAALTAAIAAAPTWAGALFAALPTRKKAGGSLAPTDIAAILPLLTTSSAEILASIVPLMIASGARPVDAIDRWLGISSTAENAEAAAQAAVVVGSEELIMRALRECTGRARAVALRALATDTGSPLSPELLALNRDTSSYVRRALVAILARAAHPEHRPSLLHLAADQWSNADAYNDDEPDRSIAQDAIAALAAYELTTAEGERLIEIAVDTPDSTVRALATMVAAQSSTLEVRAQLWAIGVEPVARWVRVDAFRGLASAKTVEPNLLEQVTSSFLLEQPPIIAVAALAVLARHGDPEDIFRIVERVAQSAKRRALLLIAALLLKERGRRDVGERLMKILPADHPAARILGLEPSEALPEAALDELGGVRTRKAVADWLDAHRKG